MKQVILASLMAVVAACSTSPETKSNTSATLGSLPDAGAYNVRFSAKNRCLTTPGNADLTTPSSPSTVYLHTTCGNASQAFLFKTNDIKAAGAFGAYVTESRGKVFPGTSSPWAVVTNGAGQTVIQSLVSGQCLVAGAKSEVTLGSCNDANATVTTDLLLSRSSGAGAAGTVACSTDNQGNAEDCI